MKAICNWTAILKPVVGKGCWIFYRQKNELISADGQRKGDFDLVWLKSEQSTHTHTELDGKNDIKTSITTMCGYNTMQSWKDTIIITTTAAMTQWQ